MHDLDLAVGFLDELPPFNLIPAGELRSIAGKLEAAYYPSGKFILKSDPPAGLAIIRKGAVRLVDASSRFLDKRSEGEFFGHRIWFHGEAKEYVAEAEEDALVWHLPQEAFERLCNRHEAVGEYFASHVKKRLRAAVKEAQPARRVRDLLKRGPVSIEGHATIAEAAKLMSRENVSSVLVMHDDALAGIVTDKDLRQRVLATGLDPSTAIQTVMTAGPKTLSEEADIDAALLLMMRGNYRHLPIEANGRPVGLVTAGDLVRAQSEHPLRLVSDIHKQDSLQGLESLSRRLPALFVRMVNLGRDVEQIGYMTTLITDAFTVRLLELAEADLGQPPFAYAWLAFGSQAREEQTAKTDQDNGLLLERDAEGAEAAYFDKLARYVCEGLDRLGYDFCPGEIMALNPKWRTTLAGWKAHFDGWMDAPEPKSVMHSSIFFDMRCVHGDARLADDLISHAIGRAGENRIFRRFMAANVLQHRPPIGFFRRFVQEDDGTHSEGLNLKHRGVVPIVDLVRMRALEAGVTEPNTFRRLERVAEEGAINEEDAGSLRDALMLIGRIRLLHQAALLQAGEDPGNLVPPEELSPLMRRHLKAAFMQVVEGQSALRVRYQVH